MSGKKLKIEFCIKYSSQRGYLLNEEVYINNKTKMNFIHKNNSCGFSFDSTWDNFYNGSECPKCYGKIKLTLEFCKEESKRKGYELLEKEYLNNKVKMNFFHETCGNHFLMNWNNFSIGKICPKCSVEKKRIILNKSKMILCKNESMKKGYILENETYESIYTKMLFIHNIDGCGFKFLMNWHNFHNHNQGCPLCSRKQFESRLATKLKKYFYDFYDAKIEFKECINPKTGYFLPYDIFVQIKNKKIYIEVQGEQHYRYDSYHNRTLEEFEYSKYKDKIKKKHAESNGTYVKIDLRKIKNKEDAIKHVFSFI